MKKSSLFLLMAMIGVAACDLQPKIVALPDTVGEFITARYPTLLADPTAQPEIYNSAATDYGVYASPELYGGASSVDDYVLYSSVDDYIVPPQPVDEPEPLSDATESDVTTGEDIIDTDDFSSDDVLVIPEQQPEETPPEKDGELADNDDDIAWDKNANPNDTLNIPMYGGDAYSEITVVAGDTLYLLGKKYNMTVDELATLNNMTEPYRLSVGQKLRVRVPSEQVVSEAPKIVAEKPAVQKPTPQKTEAKPIVKPKPVVHNTTTRVAVDEITVVPGDTLYSLSRKYSIPVNDLAVMNNLNAPFGLYAGQKLKVPDLSSAPVRSSATPAANTASAKQKTVDSKPVAKPDVKPSAKTEQKHDAKKPDKPAEKSKPHNDKAKQTKTTEKTKTVTAKKPEIAARSSSKFSWPVRGKILSNYGAKDGGLFNDGINIGATAGAAVLAAENGVVAYAGNEVKGMGNLVIVQHSDGWMTVYAHMDSMVVHRGARVRVGQKIGTVGKTGKVDKPQLHFEVRKGTKAYNPIQYLKK